MCSASRSTRVVVVCLTNYTQNMAPGAIETQPHVGDAAPGKMAQTTADSVQAALESALARFTERNPRSRALHEQALESLPGGNTLSALFTAPFPVFMKSGKGNEVTSEDGHTYDSHSSLQAVANVSSYVDLVGELTAALYGHSQPDIVAALKNVLDNIGLNLGSTIAQEHVHASEICKRFDLERVRFCNSGTEANMHALAGARAFTKKRKVVAFNGGYRM